MAEPCVSVRIDHLRCRICSHVLRDPVTVPCGHNFCVRCIQGCWDRDERTSCPDCGRVFASRPQLIMNTTLAEMVRDTVKRNRQDRGGASPPVPKRPRRSAGGPSCAVHDRPLDAYCCTDGLVVCEACASADHRGHKMGCVKLERRRKQEDLRNMQRRSRRILHQQKQKREDVGAFLRQIEGEARRTEDQCEVAVSGVIDSLQRLYMSVKRLIGVQAQEATAQAQTSLQTVEAKIEELEQRDAELDRLVQTDSDVRFLQEWPTLQLLCEKDQLHEASKELILPFEFTRKTVEDIVRKLEDIFGKEFSIIPQTGFSRVSNADVEPTTRAQFLQYACELTLDPATAHDDLVVSAEGKEVKLSPQMNKTTSIRMSEKFLHRRQVLCREGLHAERCYYEVEVQGDKAEIALAYKRIDRKSRSKLSAFGGNANSWSLDRSKSYSVSHNSDSVQLTTPPSHPRIGVYLKFREGTLSFYEVTHSMDMTFLYKDEGEFTEPLFPGFWLGEKCRIRICNLRQ